MLPGAGLGRVIMAIVALFVVMSMLVTLLPSPAN